MNTPLNFSPIIEQVQAVMPADQPVYLVGGAVRDAVLNERSHDLDFAVAKDSLKLARKVANKLQGAYYCMDQETQTGRVVLSHKDGTRTEFDFTLIRGGSLESDLRERDFTINAIAVELHKPQELLDPLGGLTDLRSKVLRVCGPNSISNDPVRVLRAVRFAAKLQLKMEAETKNLVRAGVRNLNRPSIERVRDELLKILSEPRIAASIQVLDMLGALDFLMPELLPMKGVVQPPPHVSDVWTHTIHVTQRLEQLLQLLDKDYQHENEEGGDLVSGMVSMRLGRYREQITQHLKTKLIPDRDYRGILFLSVLYHDTGKPQTQSEENGRIRFFEHEKVSAELAAKRAEHLRLSNIESNRLTTIIRNHMRPFLLMNDPNPPSRRAIYRYFRATGEAGVSIALLAMADFLATSGRQTEPKEFNRLLDVLRSLLEAYWEQPKQSVSPPALLNGNHLMKRFELEPGPQIGLLLEALREAQAVGEVESEAEAYRFAEEWLNNA
jgi:tRNA nucleotidyltransferase/poly(A) polymerase